MSLTVKHLKEALVGYRDDAIIINHEAQDFVHLCTIRDGDLLLSTEKPIGYCKRSGSYAYLTDVEDYLGVVPELDENVDLSEIELPKLDEEEYPKKFGEAIERKSKYNEPFYFLLDKVKDSLPQEIWDELYKFDIELDKK